MLDTALPRGVGVLLVQQGQIAVSFRLDERACLQFPGGHVEAGETPRAGAVRELREETGLWVPAQRLICLYEDVAAIGYQGENYLASAYMVQLAAHDVLGNPEPHKHTDWVWRDPEDLLNENMLPSSKRALTKYLSTREGGYSYE